MMNAAEVEQGDHGPGADRHGFAGYIAAVQERFAFLTGHGFGEPRVHVLPPRECTIVYWGASGTNVAIFHDLGGPPCVSVVPLPMRRADRSTRSFGVQEAVAVLAPTYEAQRPGSWQDGWDRHLDLAWLDWYADFLRKRAPALLNPSHSLLDRIESRRVRFSP